MNVQPKTNSNKEYARIEISNNSKFKKNVKVKIKEKVIPIIMWNKGNSQFATKKDEMELIIQKYNPSIFAILEANIDKDSHRPALQISGYSLEQDNLCSTGPRSRAAVFVSNLISYKRRLDLEEDSTPLLWLEIITKVSKPWLTAIGYRQWCELGLNDSDRTES